MWINVSAPIGPASLETHIFTWNYSSRFFNPVLITGFVVLETFADNLARGKAVWTSEYLEKQAEKTLIASRHVAPSGRPLSTENCLWKTQISFISLISWSICFGEKDTPANKLATGPKF